MAKVTIIAGEAYMIKLSKLANKSEAIVKQAVYKGAGTAIEAVKKGIDSLPEDKNRLLKNSDKINVVTKAQKSALLSHIGLTSMENDNGYINTKIGFDGYMDGYPTKKYPKGLPIVLLARSVESGSSVRAKRPFVRKSINAIRAEVENIMAEVVNEEINKIMK